MPVVAATILTQIADGFAQGVITAILRNSSDLEAFAVNMTSAVFAGWRRATLPTAVDAPSASAGEISAAKNAVADAIKNGKMPPI